MVVEVKEKFEKTKLVENSDKSKKCILRGDRYARYYNRILSKSRERQVVYKKAYEVSRKRSHVLANNENRRKS